MRRPVIRPVVATVLLALLFPLVGCGGQQDYCATLQENRKQIAELLATGSPTGLLEGLPMWRELAESAPRDLADEWQVYLGALEGLDDAVADAGAEPSDFEDGKPPAGLSAAERKAIADAANQIGTAEVIEASKGIETQARDVCKINLGQ